MALPVPESGEPVVYTGARVLAEWFQNTGEAISYRNNRLDPNTRIHYLVQGNIRSTNQFTVQHRTFRLGALTQGRGISGNESLANRWHEMLGHIAQVRGVIDVSVAGLRAPGPGRRIINQGMEYFIINDTPDDLPSRETICSVYGLREETVTPQYPRFKVTFTDATTNLISEVDDVQILCLRGGG